MNHAIRRFGETFESWSEVAEAMHKAMSMASPPSLSAGARNHGSSNSNNNKSVLSNGSFIASDAISWLVAHNDLKEESKRRSHAWTALQGMVDEGVIVHMRGDKESGTTNVVFAGYSAWYYFSSMSPTIGPTSAQLRALADASRRGLHRFRHQQHSKDRVQIIEDPSPRDGYITSVNVVFASRPTMLKGWSVVVYDHVSKKSVLACGEKVLDNGGKKERNSLLQYIWDSSARLGNKLFREYASAPIDLSPCTPRKVMTYELPGAGLQIKAGQFVGLRSHKNSTLSLFKGEDAKPFKKSEWNDARVRGTFRVFSSAKIERQDLFCEICYGIAKGAHHNKSGAEYLSIYAGPFFHVSTELALMLEDTRETMDEIAALKKRGMTDAERAKYLAVVGVQSTFPALRDENPSSRVEHLCVIANDTSRQHVEPFRFDPSSRTLCLNARICFALLNQSDLETVRYFYIYSATKRAAREIVAFQRKNLSNVDPNDTESVRALFAEAKVGAGERVLRQSTWGEYERVRRDCRRAGLPEGGEGAEDDEKFERRDLHFLACIEKEMGHDADATFDSAPSWKRWYSLNLPFTSANAEEGGGARGSGGGRSRSSASSHRFDTDTPFGDETHHRLPPHHDHILVFTIKDPTGVVVDLDRVPMGERYDNDDDDDDDDKTLNSSARRGGKGRGRSRRGGGNGGKTKKIRSMRWEDVPTTDRKYVHLRHVIQDSEPAVLALCPDSYAPGTTSKLLYRASRRILAVLESSIPPGLLLWGKRQEREARSAAEILNMLFHERVTTTHLDLKVADKVLHRRSIYASHAHHRYERSAALAEIETFLRRLVVLSYRVDLRDIIPEKTILSGKGGRQFGTKRTGRSSRGRRASSLSWKAQPVFDGAEDSDCPSVDCLTLRECMLKPSESLKNNRRFVERIADYIVRSRAAAVAAAATTTTAATTAAVARGGDKNIPRPVDSAIDVNAKPAKSLNAKSLLKMWSRFFSKVYRTIKMVVATEVQTVWARSSLFVTVDSVVSRLLSRIQEQSHYGGGNDEEGGGGDPSQGSASIGGGGNGHMHRAEREALRRKRNIARLKEAVLYKARTLLEIRGDIYDDSLLKIAKQVLRRMDRRYFDEHVGLKNKQHDRAIAIVDREGDVELEEMQELAVRLMAGLPIVERRGDEMSNETKVRRRARQVTLRGPARENRVVQSWAVYGNDVAALSKLWHVDATANGSADPKRGSEVAASASHRRSRRSVMRRRSSVDVGVFVRSGFEQLKRQMSFANRRALQHKADRRRSVKVIRRRMSVSAVRKRERRAKEDVGKKLTDVIDDGKKSPNVRMKALIERLSHDFRSLRVPTAVVEANATCFKCKKPLNFCKVCATGSLQSVSISFSRPSWSVQLATSDKIARDAGGYDAGGVEANTRKICPAFRNGEENKMRLRLLHDLSDYLRISFTHSKVLANHENIGTCFSGTDAIRWLTRPDFDIGCVAGLNEQAISRRDEGEDKDEDEDDSSSSSSSDDEDDDTATTRTRYLEGVIVDVDSMVGRDERVVLDTASTTTGVRSASSMSHNDGIRDLMSLMVAAGSRVKVSLLDDAAQESGSGHVESVETGTIVAFTNRGGSSGHRHVSELAHISMDCDDVLQPLRTLKVEDLRVGVQKGDVVRLVNAKGAPTDTM
eukprot:g1076.t1